MSSASTPSSSQSHSCNASPAMLTPSRKIKSLLAQFDSDSDTTPKKIVAAGADQSTTLRPYGEGSHRASSAFTSEVLENNDDDEDVLPRVPRGRLAARMQLQSSNSTAEDDVTNEDGSAYERLKKQMAEQKSPGAESVEATQNQSASVEDDSEDGPSGPPRRRLLKRKIIPVDEHSPVSRRSRSFSPMFFPSPSARSQTIQEPVPASPSVAADDEEAPSGSEKPNARFLALVEKHRKQRLAKEAEAEEKRRRRTDKMKPLSSKTGRHQSSSAAGSEEDSDEDRAAARKLTQSSRPTRKASKKALEEMNRETQRMSRNMQLAHQARTKKKITKESLFARFNFLQPGGFSETAKDDPISSATASSAPASDAEGAKAQSSPPTSPLRGENQFGKITNDTLPDDVVARPILIEDEDELPTMEETMTQKPRPIDKGKGKEVLRGPPLLIEAAKQKKILSKPPIQVRWTKHDVVMHRGADSDSDLEVVTAPDQTRKLAVFERMPKRKAREAHSMLMLRSLAHLGSNSNGGDKKRSSLTVGEMQLFLRQQARLQAAKERAEKLQELRDKGIFIQTADERDRDQAEVEDIVERARQEAAEISRREKGAAKKDGTYQNDGLGNSSDEDDEDYNENDEADVEASGSGEENDDLIGGDDKSDNEEDLNENDDDPKVTEGLIDGEASEQSGDESEDSQTNTENEADEIDLNLAKLPSKRVSRTTRVISDDEDDEDSPQDSREPPSVSRSARKVIIPGLPMSDDLPLGLTQAFEATMADSQTQAMDPNQDSLALLRQMPDPGFAMNELLQIDSQEIVQDSQRTEPDSVPLDVTLTLTQTQQMTSLTGASPRLENSTQYSELLEPSQDVGYVMSPFDERRFHTPAPGSTIDTVIIPQDESPVVQRRGRLVRGRAAIAELSDDDDNQKGASEDGIGADISAFDIMRKAARKPALVDTFDKKKSNAREIVDEAAEESEDEYAGLGGASDDSAGEEDEEDRKMINDNSGEKVDERKLAAFYADKERASDEQAVSKLLKDITTGALRKKRGAVDDIDLSDSEDEFERKRAAKQREFARMRKALLADETVAKIAENPKKMAFLKAIEDHDGEDDMELDFLEGSQQAEGTSQSQSQTVAEVAQASGEEGSTEESRKRKRPLEPSAADTGNRLPPSLRRTPAEQAKRPATITEIRECVSFLTEDPHALDNGVEDGSSGEEAEVENLDFSDLPDDDDGLLGFDLDDNDPAFKKPLPPRETFSARRTKTNRGKVVDRLSLIRQASSSSNSMSAQTKLAFHRSSSDIPGFKGPSLLRRATTNSSFNSEASSTTGVTERGEDKEVIKRGVGAGGKKSSISYYAASREKEREKQLKRGKKDGKKKLVKAGGGGMLGGLFSRDSWG